MLTVEMEIPEISNSRLAKMAKLVRPVMSFHILPLGKWPQDEVQTYFIKLPEDFRVHNFLSKVKHLKQVDLVREVRIRTFHSSGSGGTVFHPTIAEVLAQITERYLDQKNPPGCKIVAFETFFEKRDPEYDESGNFHIATTVLLIKVSPRSGILQRVHYT